MSVLQIEIPPIRGLCAEPFSLGKAWRLLGCFGPAAVVTSLSIGAGETIMVTGLGSWSGYALLWLLVLSVVVRGGFVMYLVGRYTAVTGQSFGQRVACLPGPRGWLLLVVVAAELLVLATGLTAVAKPCGNLGVHLFSQHAALADRLGLAEPDAQRWWENAVTTLFLAAALAVSVGSSYANLEKQQIVICGLMVAGTAAATLLVGPNLIELLGGAVSFGRLPAAPEWAPPAARKEYYLNLATIFGYVGGSLSGYIAYASWVALHGWGLNGHANVAEVRDYARETSRLDYLPADPQQAARLRRLLTPLRWDVGLGATVLLFVTTAFLTAGATVLYPLKLSPGAGQEFELLTRQAVIWEQIHPILVPIYYAVVLLALWGTLASVPEAVARVAYDFLGAIWPRVRQFSFRKLLAILVAWFFVSSLFWIWGGFSFDLLTQLGALVTANLGVGVVCWLATYYNATLPPLYRPRWWVTVGGVAAGVVLLVAFAASAAGMFMKFR